jgi:putative ATP-dependent endonuclease of the OLD family
MRIARIRVQNFRSIREADLIPTEFNIFVGQNNHGKTNLFEAIEWFYNGGGNLNDIAFRRDPEAEVAVELEFSGIQAGIETVKNDKNREAFRKFAAGQDKIRVIRRKSDAGKRALWDEGKSEWSQKNFAGFDKAFNDCLPRLEYVATTTRLADVSKYGRKTPIGVMLSGVLVAILEKSPKYKEFREKFEDVFASTDSDVRLTLDHLSGQVRDHLQQQFPDCTRVSFALSEPALDDLLKTFETTINDGIETTAEEKGDGMQRALMLAIIKTYADFRREQEDLGKRFVFLLDEAELHLHPTAQRQLKNALLYLAESGDQVFLNTHSSVLVADEHPKQVICSVEKIGPETHIQPIGPTQKVQLVYELLGGSPADLLLPRNFLIVEGPSELQFLRRIIERHYKDMPPLQVIFAEGDHRKQSRSMAGVNTVLVPLQGTPIYRERLVIVCDAPSVEKGGDFHSFMDAYKRLRDNAQIFVLPVESLEQYYPQPWTKSLDQVKGMGFGEKKLLATEVGDKIDRNEFEKSMPVLFEALEQAWKKSY